MDQYTTDITYRPLSPDDSDYYLAYPDHLLLAEFRDGLLNVPTVGELRASLSLPEPVSFRYLFSVSGRRYFSSPGVYPDPFGPYRPVSAKTVRHAYPRDTAFAGALGSMVTNWYERTRFCGRCGTRTVHDPSERMVYCPACKSLYYPQICPSIIVAILHEGKLLVTRYNPEHKMIGNGKIEKPTPHYALVAGYIESGESAEDAVKREVMEEVGLKIKNIRYYTSQPWPFTSALLFGYLCDVDGDPSVTLEDGELSEAVWLSPEELPDRSDEIALTSRMIEAFRTGRIR